MYWDFEHYRAYRKAMEFKIVLTDAKYTPKRSQRIKNKIRKKRKNGNK